jgi:Putative DNA-binding domain
MALETPLPSLQRWMQTVVVHPGTTDEAVASRDAEQVVPPERLAEVILPSRTLTPVERVGVYHGMYLLRMHDCLASDYEALRHFLGDDAFMDLVRGYVQVHPSRSYSLNRLGDHLPEYLEAAEGIPRPGFCVDLARLERAVAQVFDEPEVPPLSESVLGSIPEEAWERARLSAIPGFRLLAFRYPVNAYLQTVRDDDHDHPKARAKNTWVAVYRRDYSVWRLDLTRPAHDLLADLHAGTSLGPAIASAVGKGGPRAPHADELFKWFRQWVSGGMFGGVDLG